MYQFILDQFQYLVRFFQIISWLLKSSAFYVVKLIQFFPIIIGVFSSAFAFGWLMSPTTNFVGEFANTIDYNIVTIMPFVTIGFFLLTIFEMARYQFKAMYFKGIMNATSERKRLIGKKQRLIGLSSVIVMTFVLIGVAYYGQSSNNSTIMKKTNKEIMSRYNSNPTVKFNNQKVKYYAELVKVDKRIINIRLSTYKDNKGFLLSEKRRARRDIKSNSRLRLKHIKSNNRILVKITKSQTTKREFVERVSIAFIIAIEIMMMIPFFMDVVNYKYGNDEDRVLLRKKYRAIDKFVVQSTIVAPQLPKPKQLTSQNRNNSDEMPDWMRVDPA